MTTNAPASGSINPPIHPQSSALDLLLESDAFTAIDRHFARLMERLAGTPNPAVALAAALTSRSQGLGNVCLDLRAVAGTRFPDDRGTNSPRLELPALDTWVSALKATSVVGQPTDFKPLILDASHR